ncbi:class II aldolase/adducin family protein [Chiayiivirga flava]|nr:class II aldolase/adducin family protein [Chiayiivirga flava]
MPMSTMIRPDVRDRVSPEEWQLRVDLAACYRLIALHGWSDLVFTHISAKLPGDDERFLINPYGALFEEITASSLVTVNLAGEKVDDSPFPINPAGFTIHSAIHAARHDVGCVLHVHTVNGIAVSAQKNGLMPISQQSIFVLSSLGYHGYEGVALRDDEKPRLVQHLGGNTFLMLRNHGLLTVGAGIPDAFLAMYLFETCCAIQIRAQSGGGELVQVHPQIVATAQQQAAQVTKNLGGQLVWPGLLRKLDRIDASFRE